MQARARTVATLVAIFSCLEIASAQQSFEESRRDMREMLREIEAGEVIYVPLGRSLVPMDREEFVQSLVLASLAPLSAASAGSLDRLSVEEVARLIPDLEAYRRRAREAWAATEALRRTLRAELNRLDEGRRAFDPSSAESTSGFLEGTWQLEALFFEVSSGFKEAIPKLRKARLVIDRADCSQVDRQTARRCALTGSLVLSGASTRTVEPLRDGSFEPGGQYGAGTIRFATSAPEIGGRLSFIAKLSADRGWLESGTLVWMHATANEEVGTFSARRAR